MKKTVVIFIVCIAFFAIFLTACNQKEGIETISYTDEAGLVYSLYDIDGGLFADVTGYEGDTVNDTPLNQVTVEIPNKVEYEGKIYTVTKIAELAFHRKNVTKIVVPEKVKTIGAFAFAYCEAGEIVLPSTTAEIGEYAFVNCNSLKVVRIEAEQPPKLGAYAFMFYNSSKNVYEPAQFLTIKVPAVAKENYLSSWSEYVGKIN